MKYVQLVCMVAHGLMLFLNISVHLVSGSPFSLFLVVVNLFLGIFHSVMFAAYDTRRP